MCMAAILIMWQRCGEQTFVPQAHGASMWNLADWPSGFWEEEFEECVFFSYMSAKEVAIGAWPFFTTGL